MAMIDDVKQEMVQCIAESMVCSNAPAMRANIHQHTEKIIKLFLEEAMTLISEDDPSPDPAAMAFQKELIWNHWNGIDLEEIKTPAGATLKIEHVSKSNE